MSKRTFLYIYIYIYTYRPTDTSLDDSAGLSSSILNLDIEKIAASTPMVPHTTDNNRTDANNNLINHIAHSKNISS